MRMLLPRRSVLVAITTAAALAAGGQSALAVQAAPGQTDLARGRAACTPTAPYTGCQEFTFTGADQSFTVPAKVIEISADLKGAGGGGTFEGPATGGNQNGGVGGTTKAVIPAEPGQQLTVTVGGGGKSGADGSNAREGGFGGGGHGGNSLRAGGGGGGRSGIALGSTQLAIAGGGGGAPGGSGQAGVAGTNGGGTTGVAATLPAVGGPGTQSAGGAGGTGSNPLCVDAPAAGAALQGGNGGHTRGGTAAPDAGGGGGGGWFGGGGGACSPAGTLFGDGGGGGGSGYVNTSAGVTGTTTQGGGGAGGANMANGTNGTVKIQWKELAPPAITGPADGSSAPGDGPIKGTGEPGATVTVKDKNGNTICTATVQADGSWSCTPSKPLPCGPNELTATQEKGGVTSEPETITFNAGQPCISPPQPPVITKPSPPTGTSKSPGKVTVRDQNGNVVCTTTVGADGKWSCPPGKPLPPCTELTATITKDGVTSKPSKVARTYCPPKYGKK
ncbi:Ig-like domain-containing protein [Streptomyces sp. N35]|uniref:Ig-like domain-containing protein n=1 Tax=Streptomyces sp. N35 TaxID=2795730 RepID=UPI0018F53E5C|nr:Ig-like domain-containing protein [Streptomyces sp. N35]